MGKAGKKKVDDDGTQVTTRIAIVEPDRCKPKKCNLECKKSCPVVKMGKKCIEVKSTDKLAFLSEELCIGCGICVKKCPFEAISIINLPKNLERDTIHRYGPNSFKLHRLPMPRPGQVLGLVGTNGIGKSTALKILSAKVKPNFGRFDETPQWEEVVEYFRGSDLQNYFTRIIEDNLKAVTKPQYVDNIPKAVCGRVGDIIASKDERGVAEYLNQELELDVIMDRQVVNLSGGELQRFTIAIVAMSQSDVYMYDEPSSYLDIRQRLSAGRAIRSCLTGENYVIVVEHDLAVLDYLSDYVCVLYGAPGAYGVVTTPFSVREGINVFLAGFVPTENMRFREYALNFKASDGTDDKESRDDSLRQYEYPSMTKTLEQFCLHVDGGCFRDSEIVVLLGENGCGKTTFIRLLAGLITPDEEDVVVPELVISYKPQKISPKFDGSVRSLLTKKIQDTWLHPQFKTDVTNPLIIEPLLDRDVQSLSGGELQRVALCLALGTPANLYLIDEPSAYLDSEQRLHAAKVIKRYILHAKKTAFIVEHDFIMATYLADRVIVYSGTPSVECTASCPQSLLTGMNYFLQNLNITFRRDPSNYRPRINKLDSAKDKDQKSAGTYFFLED